MGELILHIGTTKTGTSALQTFFFRNKGVLASHGIDYPQFTEQPGHSNKRNACFLNLHCFTLAGRDPSRGAARDLEMNLAILADALSGENRVLLSDENASLLPGILFGSEHPYELYWSALARILAEVGAEKISIVVYLRRQDDWIASQWRQMIKNGWGDTPLESYCTASLARTAGDYAGMLAAAERILKEPQIIVRRYDRGSFEGGDIFHDFCAATGIPWDSAFQLPSREKNVSLGFDVTEALRSFKEAAAPSTPLRVHALIPLALRLSRQNPDPSDMTPFDEAATRALMEPYLAGNKQISDIFLGGEPLFSDEYGGRPVWVPDEKRITEHRAMFRKAVEEFGRCPIAAASVHGFASRLPEKVKRPLRAVRKMLFER